MTYRQGSIVVDNDKVGRDGAGFYVFTSEKFLLRQDPCE